MPFNEDDIAEIGREYEDISAFKQHSILYGMHFRPRRACQRMCDCGIKFFVGPGPRGGYRGYVRSLKARIHQIQAVWTQRIVCPEDVHRHERNQGGWCCHPARPPS